MRSGGGGDEGTRRWMGQPGGPAIRRNVLLLHKRHYSTLLGSGNYPVESRSVIQSFASDLASPHPCPRPLLKPFVWSPKSIQ